MSTEWSLPRELQEMGMMPPGQPPPPPISRDDWWALRKSLQEFEAEMRARLFENDKCNGRLDSLRTEYDRRLRVWHLAVTLLAGSTTALLGILLTFLLAE